MTHEQLWAETASLRRQYNGLWLQEHFARTIVRRETSLTRRRLALYDELVTCANRIGGERRQAEQIEHVNPSDFRRRFLDTDTPVILKGAGLRWAASKWTPELLGQRYGDTNVRLLRAAPNEPRGKPGEGQDVNYAEIAASMNSGGKLYARFSGLLHEHPELIDDLDIDWFRTMRHTAGKFENWGFFMGGAETATGLHSSIAPNLFYQISGEKRWYIYPAKAAPFFAPAVKCSPYFYSEVDVNNPEKWPVAEAAPGWIADLEPGDVLFVPAFAWHQVHNFSPTIAVGYRWMSPRLGWRNSKIQTILAATCSNPPAWKAKGHKDLPTLLDAIDY